MSQSKTQLMQLPEWLAGIDPEAVIGIDVALFDRVRDAYNSPGRFYHTWQHVLACLAEYRQMTFEQPRSVLLALLFHDAVYVTGRKDNEAQSADLATRLLAEYTDASENERNHVAQMILLTASHHGSGTQDSDTMKLLDIDLSILGTDWPVYLAYAEGVRREYCPMIVSEFKFRIGRIKFLRSVLGQQQVFLTEEMRGRRELVARENISREIAMLESELGLVGRMIARVM